MQIVIDIPEEEYRWIKQSDKNVFADVVSKECMLHAIKNGTPLTKGHGRLIDADKLKCIRPQDVAFHKVLQHSKTVIRADKESD